jgi:hypothetical protein
MSLEFFIGIILSATLQPLVNSASSRNEYQEYFLGGKCSRCIGLTTLPPSCANCLEIWGPQPLGTLRACTGIVLPFFTVRMELPCWSQTEGSASLNVTLKGSNCSHQLLQTHCELKCAAVLFYFHFHFHYMYAGSVKANGAVIIFICIMAGRGRIVKL